MEYKSLVRIDNMQSISEKISNEQNVKTTNITVSVVIPHYNSVETLDRLLKSIGIHDDVQTIVIDDNSTKSLDSLKKIEEKYYDSVEFYKNNTGTQSAGACRNIGLEKAKGKWILFADADDFFTVNWYGIASGYFNSEYDAIYFSPTSVSEDLKTVGIRHLGQQRSITEYLENPSQENYMKCARIHCIWGKLFRRDVIEKNKCRCSETMYANDMLMSKQLFFFCKNKRFTDEVIYCVTKTDGSLTTIQSDQAFADRMGEFIKSYKFLENHYEKKDFEHIRMSGGKLLYDAYQKGMSVKKILVAAVELKKKRVRIIAKEYMSPVLFFKTYLRIKTEYKIDGNKRV